MRTVLWRAVLMRTVLIKIVLLRTVLPTHLPSAKIRRPSGNIRVPEEQCAVVSCAKSRVQSAHTMHSQRTNKRSNTRHQNYATAGSLRKCTPPPFAACARVQSGATGYTIVQTHAHYYDSSLPHNAMTHHYCSYAPSGRRIIPDGSSTAPGGSAKPRHDPCPSKSCKPSLSAKRT